MSDENNEDPVRETLPVRRKRGRPRKTDIEAKKTRTKVGRPAGDAAAIKEYKARLLNSPKSRKVLDSILDAALDDEHKNQAAAWKLVMDRLLPISYFDKDKETGRSAVNITITGVGDTTISNSVPNQYDEAVDGEFDEVKD